MRKIALLVLCMFMLALPVGAARNVNDTYLPDCPVVSLSSVNKKQPYLGQRIEFVDAQVTYWQTPLEYHWRLTNGRIIAGQGTPNLQFMFHPFAYRSSLIRLKISANNLPPVCPSEFWFTIQYH